MMLSDLDPTEVIRRLKRAGFVYSRKARGSYEIWVHPMSDRRLVIPPQGRGFSPSTIRSIIKQAGLTMEEFLRL